MAASARPQQDWWGADLLGRGADTAVWAQAEHAVPYRTLRERVSSLSLLLDAHGIRPGDTVALQGAHSFSQLWFLFALWSRHVQVMLLGPQHRGRELAWLLDHCRPQYYVSFDAPGHGSGTFHEECEILVRRLTGGRRAATDHCLIQFTSGSTGYAKIIGRTPASLLTELESFQRVDGMPGNASRVLVLGPLAHSFGLIGGILHAMNSGAMTLFSPRATPQSLQSTALRGEADTIIARPQHFHGLAEEPQPCRLPRLRRAISGGGPLDRRAHALLTRRHGIRIGQAYGTTETGIIAMDPTGWYGPTTVGRPVPGVHVEVDDGELRVQLDRSPYVLGAEEYERDTGRARYDDGWLYTGDTVGLDESSGSLRILGRLDPLMDRRPLTSVQDRHQLAERTRFRRLYPSGLPMRRDIAPLSDRLRQAEARK